MNTQLGWQAGPPSYSVQGDQHHSYGALVVPTRKKPAHKKAPAQRPGQVCFFGSSGKFVGKNIANL